MGFVLYVASWLAARAPPQAVRTAAFTPMIATLR